MRGSARSAGPLLALVASLAIHATAALLVAERSEMPRPLAVVPPPVPDEQIAAPPTIPIAPPPPPAPDPPVLPSPATQLPPVAPPIVPARPLVVVKAPPVLTGGGANAPAIGGEPSQARAPLVKPPPVAVVNDVHEAPPPPPPPTTRPARRVRTTEPTYPEELRARAIDAVVQVEVEVDPVGHPVNVTLAHASEFAQFNEQAKRAAMQDLYEPALKDGVAVTYHVINAYRFHVK